MKYLIATTLLLMGAQFMLAQNVGIGTTTPVQQLDVNGAVRIGNTSILSPGTIRYSNGKFEGADGVSWKSLESLPSGAIIMSANEDPNFDNAGFSLYSLATYTGNLVLGTNYPGSWVFNAINTSGAPTMYYHSGVWTGTRLLVYYNTNLCYSYDTLANVWTTSSANTVSGFLGRDNASCVWTGTEMIIWGGRNSSTLEVYNNGCKYNPATNIWTPIATAPVKRWLHSAVWTGSKMIVWGGNDENYGVQSSAGYTYDPVSDTWGTISSVGAPSPRRAPTCSWTGSKMIIWGGEFFTGTSYFLNDGGIYNSATDSWSPMASFYLLYSPAGCWSGTDFIVAGITAFSGGSLFGGKYNPITDSWTPLPNRGINAVNSFISVWTGNYMLNWGGAGGGTKFYPNIGTGTALTPTGIFGMYYYKKN
ncbi:MAG: hypothetical protein ABI741_00995 [Ferruginibacter sp.]